MKKLTHEEFVERANKVHNNRYSYPEKYAGGRTKISINCPDHGLFKVSGSSHIAGTKCPVCYKNNKHLTPEEFIIQSNKIHNNKYSYPGPYNQYIMYADKVNIKCPEHGLFEQRGGFHLNGNGCDFCARNTKKMTHEQFVEKANKIHGKYSYPEKYTFSCVKINIECPNHGVFKQTPNSHLSKSKCPKCALSEKKLTHE